MRACAVALRRIRGMSVEVVGRARADLEPGEPVYAAACRAVSRVVRASVEPWAVDLSGEPAWFAADVPDAFEPNPFRPDAVEPDAAEADAVGVATVPRSTVPSGARAPGVLIGFRRL